MRNKYKVWCFQVQRDQRGGEFYFQKKMRVISNMKSPNKEKLDMETYQNT